MRTSIPGIVACCLAAALTVQPAAAQQTAVNPTGVWVIDGTPWSIVLKADGTSLSGKVVQGQQEFEITDGKVDGNTVSFKATAPGGDRTITFIGKVGADDIAFTRTVAVREGGAPGGAALMGAGGPPEFKATRANPDRDVWSGSVRNAPNPNNPNPNPNVRQVTLGIREMPDPHWQWRGGSKNIPTRVFVLQNQVQSLDSFVQEGDRLTYSYTRPGQQDVVTCSLARQSDGQFSGVCRSDRAANFGLLITLTPPKEPAKHP